MEGIKNDLKEDRGKQSNARPRNLTESGRVELRLRPQDKAALSRAAALKRLDLTGYILGTVLPKAESEIAQAERLSLSERDSLRGLKLLENPPAPTARLLRAAKVGFRLPRSGTKRRSARSTTARPWIAVMPILTPT